MDIENEIKPRSTAGRLWDIFFWLGFLALLALGAQTAYRYWFVPYGAGPFPKEITIQKGMHLVNVSEELGREGLVRSPLAFRSLVVLKGEQRHIRAGQYRFEEPLSAFSLIDRLTQGGVFIHPVTFPEGFSMDQIARRLSESKLADYDRFMKIAEDPAKAEAILGFKAPSLEGFLFPDTYHFAQDMSEEDIIRAITDRFFRIFTDELRKKAEEIGLSVLETVTLASIIEKETSQPSERALISGVFHHRLERGMRLESDPTIIYGLENYDGNIRRKDIAADHPYNTYKIKGLPPGPICSPGRESLLAALNPEKTDYLYFVAKKDGFHQFSKNYREHKKAVRTFQLGK